MVIETEQETDGRWIAEVTDLPGVLVSRRDARRSDFKSQNAGFARYRRQISKTAKLCRSKSKALLLRIGWRVKRQTGLHKVLQRDGWSDYVFAFHDNEEIGAAMMARIAKKTELQPGDL